MLIKRRRLNLIKIYTNMDNFVLKVTKDLLRLEKLSDLLLWLGTLILMLIFPILSGFHWIFIVTAIYSMFLILTIVLVY